MCFVRLLFSAKYTVEDGEVLDASVFGGKLTHFCEVGKDAES